MQSIYANKPIKFDQNISTIEWSIESGIDLIDEISQVWKNDENEISFILAFDWNESTLKEHILHNSEKVFFL